MPDTHCSEACAIIGPTAAYPNQIPTHEILNLRSSYLFSGTYRRLQAVKALETLQHQFIELVLQVTQHSDSAKQCSVATARYLGYDCTATHKVQLRVLN